MVEKHNNKDKISIGLLLGMIVPLMVFIIIYLATYPELNLAEYITSMLGLQLLIPIASISVLSNLIFFGIFNKLKYIMAMRGVMIGTVFYVLGLFVLKQIY